MSSETSITGTKEEHNRNVFTPKFIEKQKTKKSGGRLSIFFPQMPYFEKNSSKKDIIENGKQERNPKNL